MRQLRKWHSLCRQTNRVVYNKYINQTGHMSTATLESRKIADRATILTEALQVDFNRSGSTLDTKFVATTARKYIKISMINNQESVHAFIDRKTGDVFKPASWRGPAKIVRYNLLDEVSYGHCLARADWAGGYLYMR